MCSFRICFGKGFWFRVGIVQPVKIGFYGFWFMIVCKLLVGATFELEGHEPSQTDKNENEMGMLKRKL